MDGKAIKLEINSQYILNTKYKTIMNKKLKVEAIMNYDQISTLPFSIRNLAINEKVIDIETGDTDLYLKKQLYYYCTYKNIETNEDDIIILWDDVIDETETSRLSVTYGYTLNLEVDNNLTANLPSIELSILSFINGTYGTSVKPTLIPFGVVGTTEDEKSKELAKYKESFEMAKKLVDKLANLKQIETLINYFAKDDMNKKIKEFGETLTNMQETVNTISEMIS